MYLNKFVYLSFSLYISIYIYIHADFCMYRHLFMYMACLFQQRPFFTASSRLVPGGLLYIDDYCSWGGARTTTQEFFEKRLDLDMRRFAERKPCLYYWKTWKWICSAHRLRRCLAYKSRALGISICLSHGFHTFCCEYPRWNIVWRCVITYIDR